MNAGALETFAAICPKVRFGPFVNASKDAWKQQATTLSGTPDKSASVAGPSSDDVAFKAVNLVSKQRPSVRDTDRTPVYQESQNETKLQCDYNLCAHSRSAFGGRGGADLTNL